MPDLPIYTSTLLAPFHLLQDMFTYCDRSIRWQEAIPIVDMIADTVAYALISCWISRFGVPSSITTDGGCQFESALWQQ